jgi:hypothetical protein
VGRRNAVFVAECVMMLGIALVVRNNGKLAHTCTHLFFSGVSHSSVMHFMFTRDQPQTAAIMQEQLGAFVPLGRRRYDSCNSGSYSAIIPRPELGCGNTPTNHVLLYLWQGSDTCTD